MPQNVAPSQPGLVPAAVRRQVEEADRLIAQLNAPPSPPAPNAPPAPPAPTLTVVPTPQPAPPPPVQHQQQPPAPQDPNSPDGLQEALRQERHRYSVLQGKYNSEVPQLRAQLDHNTQLVTQLLERDRTPPAPPAPAQTPQERLRALGASDEDIREYGELLPLILTIAENMAKPTMAKVEAELQRLQQAQGATAGRIVTLSRDQVFDALTNAVPNWRLINEADHFLDWLSKTDVFSGITRRVALADAFNKLDAARVTAIFQAYVGEHPEQARTAGPTQIDPSTLVAPDIRGSAPVAPGGGGGVGRIWSESEIRDFYTKVRKKQVTPEEYSRMMAEIASATQEGRIRPDRVDLHSNSR